MTLHHTDDTVTVHLGDCLDILREIPDNSIDAIVTDPPYGLGFMGKAWDDLPPGEAWAVECLRVLKPGGHLLAFGGTRTWHRLFVAVEDAGFEMRDSIAWLYGSGFPKSLDVSKAIDKMHGAEREVIGPNPHSSPGRAPGAMRMGGANARPSMEARMSAAGIDRGPLTAPATSEAQTWQGWGTALKPIVVARKPLAGTVAGNVHTWGTGALNIDGCRVDSGAPRTTHADGNRVTTISDSVYLGGKKPHGPTPAPAGRWPANVVLDGSQADALDQQSGIKRDGVAVNRRRDSEVLASEAGWGYRKQTEDVGYGGEGGASRFFPTFRYQAKAPTRERVTYEREDEGRGDYNMHKRCTVCGKAKRHPSWQCECPNPVFENDPHRTGKVAHPTVKPLDLMRWLVRLVTPPGGTVLDTFAGSGTTGEACILEGFACVLIERETDYLPLIDQRVARARATVAVSVPDEPDIDPAA